MAGQPVVMCVDLVADRFITGTPKRISREAPVLILKHEKEEFVPGGGANAVANVSALGGRPLPLGVVGTDANGVELINWLDKNRVPTEGIARIEGYRTPTKTRVLGGGRHSIKQQIVRFDIEDQVIFDDNIASLYSRALESWKGSAKIAVLSDYGYGAVQPQHVGPLRQTLGESGVVLCDSRHRLADFAGVDGATPNEEEAENLVGERLDDGSKRLREAGKRLRKDLRTSFVLITRGSCGMSLFEADRVAHIPTHGSDQVADVTGAGDTVIGTFALALAAGATPLEAALVADYAGGIVVHKLGTATTDADELKVAIQTDPLPLAEVSWDRF